MAILESSLLNTACVTNILKNVVLNLLSSLSSSSFLCDEMVEREVRGAMDLWGKIIDVVSGLMDNYCMGGFLSTILAGLLPYNSVDVIVFSK